MPPASPLEAIETSVGAELLLVDGLESVTLAPVASFKVDEDGTVTLTNVTLPDVYPGAVLSLNEEDITIVTEPRTLGRDGTAFNYFRVPVSVAIYAHSDGATLTAARWKAWEVGHAALIVLTGFIPTGAPSPWVIEKEEAMEPGPITPIVIDANTHGILLRFYAKYFLING